MIPVQTLIDHFRRMLDEGWVYNWGAAETGNVDCSGAFVWAYRQEGESIYHGSNRIAREYVVELLPISAAAPGMAAFKLRRPGEALYSLPQGYQPGEARYNGDLNDYHHIGLVDNDPAFVLNAKGTAYGFKRDRISDGWDCVARLKAVSYADNAEEGDTVMQTAIVIASNNSSVNLRARPSTKGELVDRVPLNEEVQVLSTGLNDQGEEWSRVNWGKRTGYMMAKFLRMQNATESPQESTPPAADEVTLTLPRSAAAALCEALEAIL